MVKDAQNPASPDPSLPDVIARWAEHGFGSLREERLAILAATVISVGAQIFFTSFLLSIIGLRRRRDEP